MKSAIADDVILACVVPLIHPVACRNWGDILARLTETLRSISACAERGQTMGIVVANVGSELPTLPSGVIAEFIELPPPSTSVFVGEVPEDERRNVKQLDKGTKVLTGCMLARDRGARYVMTVDADDLISSRLPGYIRQHCGGPGWYVDKGWVLPVGNRWAYLRDDFVRGCGTSLIIRTDLLDLPRRLEQRSSAQISRWFGSHKFIRDDLASENHVLEPIPFAAAVYRTGHTENNTGKGAIRDLYFPDRLALRSPLEFARRAARLRPFNQKLRQEFHAGKRPA